MSNKALCEVTCDRCGHVDLVPAELIDDHIMPAKYPDGFSLIQQHQAKLHKANRFDLCHSCTLDFESWMKLRGPNGRPLPCRHNGCTHTADPDSRFLYCMNHLNEDAPQ